MGKVSWPLGAKKYHKVTLHNKPHTFIVKQTSVIYWERHKTVAAPAQERSSQELSRRQVLYRVSWEVGKWSFPGWPRIWWDVIA